MKESYSWKILPPINYSQNILPIEYDLNNKTINNNQSNNNKIINMKQRFHNPKQNSISIASIQEYGLTSNNPVITPVLNPQNITSTSHKYQIPIRINKKKLQRAHLIKPSNNSNLENIQNDNSSNFLNYKGISNINKLNFNKLKRLDDKKIIIPYMK